MSVRIGLFDPMQLIFGVMNSLMRRNLISYEDARDILKESLPPGISELEKNKILDGLIKRSNGGSNNG